MSSSFPMRLRDRIFHCSTFMGKLWLPVHIVLRTVLIGVGCESVYRGEQRKIICNSIQPGCESACSDAFGLLLRIRFWVFQIIVITTPTILYLVFARYKIARMPGSEYEEARDRGEKKEKEKDGRKKSDILREIKCYGLLYLYVIELFSRLVFEMAFLFAQYMCARYIWYGFVVSPATVSCYVSHPTDENILLSITIAVSGICLLLTMLEVLHLLICDIFDGFPLGLTKQRTVVRPRRPLYNLSEEAPKSRVDEASPQEMNSLVEEKEVQDSSHKKGNTI